MSLKNINSPTEFMCRMGIMPPDMDELQDYEGWMRDHGQAISDAVDRAGTPHLQMFDALGKRIDKLHFPPEYWTMLHAGYNAGMIANAIEQQSVMPFYHRAYVASYFDVGL